MTKTVKRGEPITRIVFGGIFLIAGEIVELLLSGAYTFVALVLFINGLACLVSGIIDLVKANRAIKAARLEKERADAEKKAFFERIAPDIERCRALYYDIVSKYEHKVYATGLVFKDNNWCEYQSVCTDGEELLFLRDCRIDRMLDSDSTAELSAFGWDKYSFDDEVICRCSVSDIVFFKLELDGAPGVNRGKGRVLLRVGNEQLVLTSEAYNVLMQLIPEKEFNYIMATNGTNV